MTRGDRPIDNQSTSPACGSNDQNVHVRQLNRIGLKSGLMGRSGHSPVPAGGVPVELGRARNDRARPSPAQPLNHSWDKSLSVLEVLNQ